MNKVILYSLCLALAASMAVPLQAQQNQNQPDLKAAETEAIRRQAWKLELDRKLAEAQAAEKKGAFQESATLYTDCMRLIKSIGPVVTPEEQQQALDGLIATRVALAQQAERAGDYGAAEDQYAAILREDPKNERIIQMR